MKKIRVLLADDHTMVRKGIRSLLDDETGIEVVGEANDGRDALEQIEALQPDVVLMDITMPKLNGLEATRLLKKRFPEAKVLILTMHTNEEYLRPILQAGALGYVVKNAAPMELILAVETVHRGDHYLSTSMSGAVVEGYLQQQGAADGTDSYDSLTDREREVLQLIAEGHSTQEIAEQLCISPNTVRNHKANLTNKLGIHSVAELTQYAIRKGVISLE